MEDLQPLGAAVREARQARGLTLRALAERAGLSERFLSDLERGKGNIAIGRLWQVGRALEVPLAELVAALDDAARGAGALVVALVGLRGAGKSTIGSRAAAALEVPFVELDLEVEAAAGLSLPEIFEIHGEAYFRRLEREVLARLLAEGAAAGAVIAAGGGLVTDLASWRLLRQKARTVWLKAEPEEHYQRVVNQGDLRPMRDRPAAMAELRAILTARAPLYGQAAVTVDTSRLGLEGAMAAVVAAARGEGPTSPTSAHI